MEEGDRIGPARPQGMIGAEFDFLGGVEIDALDDLGWRGLVALYKAGWRFFWRAPPAMRN